MIYFDTISSTPICLELSSNRDYDVAEPKAAYAKVYDYYDTCNYFYNPELFFDQLHLYLSPLARSASVSYDPPTVSICDICGSTCQKSCN